MRYSCCTIFALAIALGCEAVPAIALPPEVPIPTSADGKTIVTTKGNLFEITGTQVSGKNQFHNFQTFDLKSGQVADFIPNSINIQNILSRVSGGTPSQIQGMIKSANGVNLFLMNPSGILFGNGASLDIKGSFTATTANAIGFGNNLWFNAAGNNNTSALTGDPIQFSFTSANPGTIVNTGTLTLPANQSLNLIGGTVINTGTIATPGGNITIAAVEGGKAVQISTPGSILSYTLPIESINTINPAIGSPVSLSKLLEGPDGETIKNASGVEIKNGVITLVRSQTPLQDRSGLAIISGTINTKDSDPKSTIVGGKIDVVGKTIAIGDPTITTKEGSVLFNADRRLLFEDQADDSFSIGNFNGAVNQVNFTASSSNGVIESIDPNDTITVTGSPLFVSASRINLGNLNILFGIKTSTGVNLTATNNIQVGDIKTAGGGVEILSQEGNIKARNISAPTDKFTNKLTAIQGSIEVTSIFAGAVNTVKDANLALDIFAGKTFRVTGTTGQDSYTYPLALGEDQLFEFLSTKVGKKASEIKSTLTYNPSGPFVTVETPVSIHVGFGGVRIRYMGGGGEVRTLNDRVTVQGGNNRFEIGPKATSNTGDLYIPRQSTDLFENFIEKPFALVKNVNYQPIVISEGSSGTVGGIIRSFESNGQVWIGTLDQTFGVLPKPIEVKPIEVKPIEVKPIDSNNIDPKPIAPKVPTIDLETRNPAKLATCPETKTIAIAPTEATRSSESPTNPSTSSVSKNPCLTDKNEDEILKILK
jgi:filamentous hemagglutinin family protein